jgi:hypothetical protein
VLAVSLHEDLGDDPWSWTHRNYQAMIGENRQLVPNEPVEFEKLLVKVQDFGGITDHFRGIYGIHLKSR